MPFSDTSRDYDAIPIVRSYDREVVRPLEALKGGAVTTLRRLRYGSHNYPFLSVQSPPVVRPEHPTVLVSAGVHGDEPAGVYAIVDFLEHEAGQYADKVNLCVFPCMNPGGFEANTRHTMSGVDLNRSFDDEESAKQETFAVEVFTMKEWMEYYHPQVRLALDLHENNPDAFEEDIEEADGGDVPEETVRACYLYESCYDTRRRIGRQLIDALPYSAAVCLLPTIEGEVNDRGVIAYPEARKNAKFRTTLDAYVAERWTDHTIVTETPVIWSMEKRIAVQRLWLRRALDLVLAEEGSLAMRNGCGKVIPFFPCPL